MILKIEMTIENIDLKTESPIEISQIINQALFIYADKKLGMKKDTKIKYKQIQLLDEK